MNLDHLKYCQDAEHHSAYSCARCNRVYCMTCDRTSEIEEVLTIVRYCPDWRCQREKRIEEGDLTAYPAAFLAYARHAPDCDALGQMWNQGPCDCGLAALKNAASPWVRMLLGPGAFACPSCGDSGLYGDDPCPNCTTVDPSPEGL